MAAGAGAVYRSMQALGLADAQVAYADVADLPAGSGDGKSVVILGAGIAGLTAAYELSRAGYHCTVLEASARAGGRNLTARAGDRLVETGSEQPVDFDPEPHLYANMGPARIPYHHRRILGYCKAFGVELEVFSNDNRAGLFHNVGSFGGRPVTARQVNTDLRGYIAELLAKAVNHSALDLELTTEDKERVLDMLSSYGDLGADGRYQGSSRGGYLGEHLHAGLEAGQVADPLGFSEILKSEFWQYKLHFDQFLNQNPTLLQPVGGMDQIVRAFEDRVGHLIRYNSIVRQIRKSPQGVRIHYERGEAGDTAVMEADFAICSIPAPVLRDIPSDFSPEVRTTIDSLDFSPAVKLAFQTRSRYWEDDHAIYGGISWTDLDITQIWYPGYGFHRQKGILFGAYIWDDEPATRFGDMAPEERLRQAAEQGDRLHAGYSSEIESGVSRAWAKVPFQMGAWPAAEEAPETLRRPDGNIYFAGDQVSALPGWQEGAVLAALEAISNIHERVMAG